MTNKMWAIFILQLLSIALVLAMILLIYRQARAIKFQKRLAKFSINPLEEKDKSFFDKLLGLVIKLIKKISNSLEKNKPLVNYSYKFERYISFDDRDKIDPMDYISAKLLFGLFIILLAAVTMILKSYLMPVWLIILLFLFGFFIPDLVLWLDFKRKTKIIEEDLLKAVIIMNNAFKSGRNIIQAVEIVKDELSGPISDEFQKIYIDINYGLSLEVVFNRFYERVKLEDAKYITSSLDLLNKTGGNIVKVFSMIEKSFFDKQKLKNELASITSASRLVYRILLILPFIISAVITLIKPSYYKPLITTPIGWILLFVIVILYVIYILIIKRVMKVIR